MATVTSLTAARIEELLAGWQSVGLSQDEINALVVQLRTSVGEVSSSQEHFDSVVRPVLEENTAATANAVSALNDNVLPDLQSQVDSAAMDIEGLTTIDIPALRADMDNAMVNVADSPHVYVQPEAPESPDENDRYLVVGDSWFDSDDDNKQQLWNGTEWTVFAVDIPDLSLTVKKFQTSTHMLY